MNEIQPVIELLQQHEYELFKNDMREPFVVITLNGAKRTYPLHSSEFKRLLSYLFTEQNRTQLKTKVLKQLISYLEGQAIYNGAVRNTGIRIQGDMQSVEIDICDESYEVIRITREGWSIQQPEQHFMRPHALRPLIRPVQVPESERTQVLEETHRLLNLSDDQFKLYMGFLLSCFKPGGPYPILAVQGEQGSAKGCLCEFGKSVVDPNMTPHTALPNGERDMAIQATNNHLISYDNLSAHSLTKKNCDAMAKLSTGAGFRTRRLYTNDEEMVFQVCRPLIINGIDDLVTQTDVGSRSIVLKLDTIPEENRITKQQFEEGSAAVLPRLLGMLMDAVQRCLANYAETRIVSQCRMIDMIQWVAAGEQVLGWEPGTFQNLFEANQKEAMKIGVNNDPVGIAIVEFMQTRPNWEGGAAELLSNLVTITNRSLHSSMLWPKNPIGLGHRINRIKTALRSLGIEVERERTGQQRMIRLEHIVQQEPTS